MPNYQIIKDEANAAKEIKASRHYAYIDGGITLDGSKFTAGELIVEGQVIARNTTSGKFEKYADATGAWPAGYDTPLVLDESVRFTATGDPETVNFDESVGQAMWHGAVIESLCVGVTAAFKAKIPMVAFV
jgi:hypothetical protein